MKIKTSELVGPALDWAVENIEIARMRVEGEHIKEWLVEEKQSNPSPYATDPLLAWPITVIVRRGSEVSTFRAASPQVASQVGKGWAAAGYAVTIFCHPTDGNVTVAEAESLV